MLALKLTKQEIMGFTKQNFFVGLFITWLVGMGRYWDDPNAKLLQHLGLGSVIYIFCMSTFIWLIVKPFKIDGWKYITVLTFVSFTSLPALLYAIPIEKFTSINIATKVNAWFLIIVAFWRVTMLFNFLKKFTALNWVTITAIALLPICFIIVLLSLLNLERAVFNIMGGFRQTVNDKAYEVLLTLTMISIFSLPFLLILYADGIITARKNRK